MSPAKTRIHLKDAIVQLCNSRQYISADKLKECATLCHKCLVSKYMLPPACFTPNLFIVPNLATLMSGDEGVGGATSLQ